MAVLAAMGSIALDMVIRVAGAFWITAWADTFMMNGSMSDGMTSQAMQQGGMGLILTTLILTAPTMAAFFRARWVTTRHIRRSVAVLRRHRARMVVRRARIHWLRLYSRRPVGLEVKRACLGLTAKC